MKKLVFLSIILLLSTAERMFAQGCSVCTQTANQLDGKGADGLNNGIIYLAFLPLTFIAAVGFLWWKYNRRSRA